MLAGGFHFLHIIAEHVQIHVCTCKWDQVVLLWLVSEDSTEAPTAAEISCTGKVA